MKDYENKKNKIKVNINFWYHEPSTCDKDVEELSQLERQDMKDRIKDFMKKVKTGQLPRAEQLLSSISEHTLTAKDLYGNDVIVELFDKLIKQIDDLK